MLEPWHRGRGHGAAGMCDRERRGARGAGGDCGRPQSAAQTHRAGADCPRLGRSARDATGGAEHRCQPADRVALATRFAESGVDGLLRDKTRNPARRRSRRKPRRRSWRSRAPSHRTKPPTGPAGRWPKPSASRWARYSASGRRTNCSRTGCAPSSARAIPALPTSSLTLLGSMSIAGPCRGAGDR